MDELDKCSALVEKLEKSRTRDKWWGRFDFLVAQTFLWLAISSSFATALFAMSVETRPYISFLAAIPGAVIVIDKTFCFARRASWHWEMITRTDRLLDRLRFEGGRVEDVSRDFGELRIAMEQRFPQSSTDWIAS